MKKTNCGSCRSPRLHTVLDLGLSPIADAYTSAAEESVPHYPLQLAVCTDCWLVQLLEVVDQKTLFGTGYSFYSSASPPLSAYHEQYATNVMDTRDYELLSRRPLVVEVGCNDGDMLRHFVTRGWQTIGVDPAEGPADMARERTGGLVLNRSFSHEVGREIRGEHGPADVVIANHVLAHVEDVSSVLGGIGELLGARGVAYVEVQYLPDLLLGNAFDLVYHEHRNFFSLRSFENAAARHGMHVSQAWTTSRQGGSLRAQLLRGADSTYVSGRVESIRNAERWLTTVGAYEGLQGRAERLRTRLQELLEVSGKHVVGYGAPAKATTLLNFCGIDANQVKYVTDTTVAKQNRFIPGTGIEIKPPSFVEQDRVDTYLLLAWNYTSEITRREVEFTRNGGRWIVPAPAPYTI